MLAYYGICKLQIHNVFIVQAPGVRTLYFVTNYAENKLVSVALITLLLLVKAYILNKIFVLEFFVWSDLTDQTFSFIRSAIDTFMKQRNNKAKEG